MLSSTLKISRSLPSFSTRNFASAVHTPICIIGAGSAGINVSAQLVRSGVLKNHIRIFDPSKYHHYQPGWTMVGGGLEAPNKFISTNDKMIPIGLPWTELAVTKIDPANNTIETEDGAKFTYDQLIVAAGIVPNFEAVKGLTEALSDPNIPVGTIYHAKYAQKWAKIRENFTGGKAIFTDPLPPVKCGGAPQKITYLSHDFWNNKKRVHPEINYYTASPAIFVQPHYAKKCEEIASKKGITVNKEHNLIEVRGKEQVAVFQNRKTQENVEAKFDVLHVVAPLRPQTFLKECKALTNEAGYVDVDPSTLRSTRYNNVWSLGDCSNIPTSKTIAAITEQTPVLVHNVVQTIKGHDTKDKFAAYYGYTGCPIFVGGDKVLLAEFKYGAERDESFGPLNNSPQKFFFYLKKHFFPFAYFNFMRRGLWYGRHGFLKPNLEQIGETKKAN